MIRIFKSLLINFLFRVSSTYKHETDFKEQKKTYRNSEGNIK